MTELQLLAAILLGVACVGLLQWQIWRHERKLIEDDDIFLDHEYRLVLLEKKKPTTLADIRRKHAGKKVRK